MPPTASALAQTRPPQPVPAQPIVVLIHRDEAGNWTIGPEDEQSNSGRFRAHNSANDEPNTFDGQWRSRNGKNAPQPRTHDPIFFLEGDVFQFQCKDEFAFGIGATKNPDVQALPGAPDDPFESWQGGEQGLDGTRISRDGQPLTATVKTSDGEAPGVKAQRFYKFHGWVRVNGEFKPVDPDGYCGG
jgi:hypothetical protein